MKQIGRVPSLHAIFDDPLANGVASPEGNGRALCPLKTVVNFHAGSLCRSLLSATRLRAAAAKMHQVKAERRNAIFDAA
jgi:hypothetical protein